MGLETIFKRKQLSATKCSQAVKPKRPLSSYNLFYKFDRERLLANKPDLPATTEHVRRLREQDKCKTQEKRIHRKTHGKISFVELSKAISTRWNELDYWSKKIFEEQAAEEKQEYDDKVREYKYHQDLLLRGREIEPTTDFVVSDHEGAGLFSPVQTQGQQQPIPHVKQEQHHVTFLPSVFHQVRAREDMVTSMQEHNGLVVTTDSLQQLRHRIDNAIASLAQTPNIVPSAEGSMFSSSSSLWHREDAAGVGRPYGLATSDMIPDLNLLELYALTATSMQESPLHLVGFESSNPLDAHDMEALFD